MVEGLGVSQIFALVPSYLRGMGVPEMESIGDAIARILESRGDAVVQEEVRRTVAELCAAFPLPV